MLERQSNLLQYSIGKDYHVQQFLLRNRKYYNNKKWVNPSLWHIHLAFIYEKYFQIIEVFSYLRQPSTT